MWGYSGECTGGGATHPAVLSRQTASLSLLKLSFGMLNIGLGGSAFCSEELTGVSATTTGSQRFGWPVSVLWVSPVVLALSLPQPRGPLHKARGFVSGFSVVSDKVVSSELTLFVDLLTFNIELLVCFPVVAEPVLLWPFSWVSGSLGGERVVTELFLEMTGGLSPRSGSLKGTRALMSQEVLVFLNLENNLRTRWSWDWLRAGSFFRFSASSFSRLRSDTFRNISYKIEYFLWLLNSKLNFKTHPIS